MVPEIAQCSGETIATETTIPVLRDRERAVCAGVAGAKAVLKDRQYNAMYTIRLNRDPIDAGECSADISADCNTPGCKGPCGSGHTRSEVLVPQFREGVGLVMVSYDAEFAVSAWGREFEVCGVPQRGFVHVVRPAGPREPRKAAEVSRHS